MEYQVVTKTDTTVVIKIQPQPTFLELVQLLNPTQLCKKRIQANNFSKLLRGERRCYYNCQLISIATFALFCLPYGHKSKVGCRHTTKQGLIKIKNKR